MDQTQRDSQPSLTDISRGAACGMVGTAAPVAVSPSARTRSPGGRLRLQSADTETRTASTNGETYTHGDSNSFSAVLTAISTDSSPDRGAGVYPMSPAGAGHRDHQPRRGVGAGAGGAGTGAGTPSLPQSVDSDASFPTLDVMVVGGTGSAGYGAARVSAGGPASAWTATSTSSASTGLGVGAGAGGGGGGAGGGGGTPVGGVASTLLSSAAGSSTLGGGHASRHSRRLHVAGPSPLLPLQAVDSGSRGEGSLPGSPVGTPTVFQGAPATGGGCRGCLPCCHDVCKAPPPSPLGATIFSRVHVFPAL